jgi:hypothetical protein
MNELNCRRKRQRLFHVTATQATTFQKQYGTDAFAAAFARVTHNRLDTITLR